MLGNRPRTKPQRPYIRTAAADPQALDAPSVRLAMVALAIGTGFAVGVVVFLLVNASTWLTGLLWKGLGGSLDPAGAFWFPLVACTLGGLVIGLWTLWSDDRVRPLEEVMGQFKRTGSYRVSGPVKPVVSFLLPLVFGGSVGFEAGLTGIITASCCWVRDKLKAAGLRVAAVADVTIAASIAAIFGSPFAGIVAGAESDSANDSALWDETAADDGSGASAGSARRAEDARGANPSDPSPNTVDAYDMRRNVKLVLYTAAAAGAFAAIAALSELFGVSGGLPRFEAIGASYAELLWAIPCIVVAYAMTLVFHGSSTFFGGISKRLGGGSAATVIAPVVAGAIMGAIAMAFPYVLFPGEVQSEELMGSWTTWAAAALLATGVLKAAITPMCLKMGWMGGSFFPSIFAGVACGYGLAALTGADPMLMVTVTTAAYLAGVTRRPVLSLAILALCFPLTGILWSGLAAVVGGALPVPPSWLETETRS